MEEEYKQVAVYYAYATLCECRFAVLPDDDEIQHSIPTYQQERRVMVMVQRSRNGKYDA